MRDNQQPASCACGPFELVQQTEDAAFKAGIHYGGENALPRYDADAYNAILSQSRRPGKPTINVQCLRILSIHAIMFLNYVSSAW